MRLRLLLLLTALTTLAGCEPLPEDVGLRITSVMQSDYCGHEQPSAYQIEQESQWQALHRGGERFLPNPADDRSNSQRYRELAANSLLVVVAAGQKPSAGYRVVVDTYDWQRELDELTLQVAVEGPTVGTVQATVLTSPCNLVAIRNYQGISQLRFTGLNGDLIIPTR